jgi:hypothetical protein
MYPMCFSFWGVPRGDSRLTNQSATWLVYLRGVSISPQKSVLFPQYKIEDDLIKSKVFFLNKIIKRNKVNPIKFYLYYHL